MAAKIRQWTVARRNASQELCCTTVKGASGCLLPALYEHFPLALGSCCALFSRETLHFLARPEAQKGGEATASSDLSTSERALLMGTSGHFDDL